MALWAKPDPSSSCGAESILPALGRQSWRGMTLLWDLARTPGCILPSQHHAQLSQDEGRTVPCAGDLGEASGALVG